MFNLLSKVFNKIWTEYDKISGGVAGCGLAGQGFEPKHFLTQGFLLKNSHPELKVCLSCIFRGVPVYSFNNQIFAE